MTPRDLQTLRNMGNEAEEAADEIDRLRAELERLRAQEPVAWAYVNTDGECEEITWDSGPCPEECICLYRAAPPAQPAPDPELTQFENDLIESVGQMMRGESVELPVQQWISADHPPTNTQEYVHDLLVRNRYGNVAIVSYDGYAKYFEAESANRLGGHEVVEWRHLPSDFAQPAQRLTDDPQWQPIETAPKDGTLIVIWFCARPGEFDFHPGDPITACFDGTEWIGAETGDRIDLPLPTHWIPLPAAPKG